MRIKKKEQSVGILGKITSLFSNSKQDAYSCDYINNALKDTYLNEEQAIGTWTDGRTLYRKVLTFNTEIANTGASKIPHNIDNARYVMIKNAYIYHPTSGIAYPLPVTFYNSNTKEDRLSVMADRKDVTFYSENIWNEGWYKVVILEYTKDL